MPKSAFSSDSLGAVKVATGKSRRAWLHHRHPQRHLRRGFAVSGEGETAGWHRGGFQVIDIEIEPTRKGQFIGSGIVAQTILNWKPISTRRLSSVGHSGAGKGASGVVGENRGVRIFYSNR